MSTIKELMEDLRLPDEMEQKVLKLEIKEMKYSF